MPEEKWFTAVTEVKPNELRPRGYRLDDLMGRRTFGEVAWLVLTGELPQPQQRQLIEALVMCGVDHGVTPPSTLATRIVTGTGASLSQAVAAGVLAINASHGGAIEGCMRALTRGVELAVEQHLPVAQAAQVVLAALKAQGKRIPGFGHRLHTADPRTARLRELAREAGVYGNHLQLADAMEAHFAAQGQPLPLNVDGAVAAVLCELAVPPELGNGFFVLPRVVGLIAHHHEELAREKVMRRINPADAVYDGPPARELL
jgi:citrate synthase